VWGQKDDDSLESDAIIEEKSPIPASTVPQRDQDDCRNQFLPDGKHNQTREAIEGNQRVVERIRGELGDDVSFSFAFYLFL
jgi:hypothetical protein